MSHYSVCVCVCVCVWKTLNVYPYLWTPPPHPTPIFFLICSVGRSTGINQRTGSPNQTRRVTFFNQITLATPPTDSSNQTIDPLFSLATTSRRGNNNRPRCELPPPHPTPPLVFNLLGPTRPGKRLRMGQPTNQPTITPYLVNTPT